MSITQGGSGFPFMAPPVYEYISSGKYTDIECDIENISEPTLKFAVKKVKEAIIVGLLVTSKYTRSQKLNMMQT